MASWANLFARANPVTATAVALAEHGGSVNPAATHRNSDGSIDTGVWQINSVHRRTHPEWTVAWLQVPENNARAMEVVSGGGSNWQPWSTFRDGKYRSYLAQARTAVEATSGSTGDLSISERLGDVVGGVGDIASNPLDVLSDVAGAITGGFGAVVEFVNRIGAWITDPHNWIRVGYVIGGGLLVVAAGAALAGDTRAGQAVNQAVGSVTTRRRG